LGAESVVVLDAKKRGSGYEAMTKKLGCATGKDLAALAAEHKRCGPGKIVVNSIDRDDIMNGYDLPLARAVRATTTVPLTVRCGAGSLRDISQLSAAFGVVGAAAGSLLVFKGGHRTIPIIYTDVAVKDALLAAADAAR
jgi:cyclase